MADKREIPSGNETGFMKWLKSTQTPYSRAELPGLYSSWWATKTEVENALADRTVAEHMGHIRTHIQFLTNEGVENYKFVYGLSNWDARARVKQEIERKTRELKELEKKPANAPYAEVMGLR